MLTMSQFGKALERPEIAQIHLDEIASETGSSADGLPKVEVQPDDWLT